MIWLGQYMQQKYISGLAYWPVKVMNNEWQPSMLQNYDNKSTTTSSCTHNGRTRKIWLSAPAAGNISFFHHIWTFCCQRLHFRQTMSPRHPGGRWMDEVGTSSSSVRSGDDSVTWVSGQGLPCFKWNVSLPTNTDLTCDMGHILDSAQSRFHQEFSGHNTA